MLPVGGEAKSLATAGILLKDSRPADAASLFLQAAEASVCLVGSAVYLAHASVCFENAGDLTKSARVGASACKTAEALGLGAGELVSTILRGPSQLDN